MGGHVVKMDRLRAVFASLGLASVETFIASGNVIFESRAGAGQALERKIEGALAAALGYEVAAFVRTDAELAATAAAEHFPPGRLRLAAAHYIAFLREAPDAAAKKRVMALRAKSDLFVFAGREFHVVSWQKISESKFTGAALERALAAPATVRAATTVRKLAAKYPPRDAPEPPPAK